MEERAVIYTKPECPFCLAAKVNLNLKSIPYTEYNVKADPKRLEEMLRLNGGLRRVPTMVRGDKVCVGFGGF